jgi:hypothetical protein
LLAGLGVAPGPKTQEPLPGLDIQRPGPPPELSRKANGVYGSIVHVVDHGLPVLVMAQEALEVVFLSGLG